MEPIQVWNSGNNDILQNNPEFFLENYTKTLEDLKKINKPLIGYFTNRIPVEIIHALNLLPIRILSLGKAAQGSSERYIQIFACSWLRQIMDIGLTQGYESLDGLLFSAGTCDSLQNFSDIWKKVFPDQWVYNLTFPVLTDSDLARDYLQNELETLIENLAIQFLQQHPEIRLSHSIKLYNIKRANLLKLAELVSTRKLKYSTLAKHLLIGDILPVEIINQNFGWKINKTLDYPAESLPDSPRIMLVGGMFDNYTLFDLPEFDHIVADDLSFGTRNFNFQIPENSFIQRYSQAYLDRVPDPTAFDMEKRINGVEQSIKGHKIDGIVLLGQKWCDPDAFEFVPIQNRLKSLEVPFLNIETTPELSNKQQIQTRLSAFIEMLG
ncbi:MAG: 2-hydroxyacyl-CoA dehydratase subunit D [Candidatus Hodarchaeales archaeon]